MSERGDLDELKRRLNDRCEEIAVALFGEPKTRNARELRFGTLGSTKVEIAGKYRGRFRSFEAIRGGSMLDAIQFANNDCTLARAIEIARSYVGEGPVLPPPKRSKSAVVDVDRDEARKTALAARLFAEATPIAGTPAEKYLRGRAIALSAWPDDAVRWHGDKGMVVFAVRDETGKVIAIQRVFLRPDGSPQLDDDGKKIKRTLGARHGRAVVFPGRTGPLLLAEGPETALSAWYATGFETWATLGSIASVSLAGVPIEREIVVCRDDDARIAPSRKALLDAIRRWRGEGRTVVEALPWERTRRDKSDLNDALQACGADYVRARIDEALHPMSPAVVATTPIDARKQLARATNAAIERLVAWDDLAGNAAPVLCLKVGLGLGKTTEALRHVIRLIGEGRGPIVYAVPTHDLGAELVERAKLEAKRQHVALTVATWRGREAENPDAPGEQMCRNVEVVRAVQRVGGDPQQAVCRRKMPDGTVRACPYFESCAYQRQRDQKAALWLVAHHALFAQKPEAIPKPALVVIDEAFWRAGLRGVDGRAVIVTPEQLGAAPQVVKDGRLARDKTADLVAELMPIRRRLLAALDAHPFGPVEIERLVAAGLTADDCDAAAKAEWQRKIALDVVPGMTAAELRERVRAASVNVEIPRMATLWRQLGEAIRRGFDKSGRLELVDERDEKTGASYRALRLRWRDTITEGWKAPVLHTDATLNLDLVRAYLPAAELVADVEAEAPHQRVVQITGKSFAKGALANNSSQIDKVWAAVVARARRAGGRWLAVAQKAVEEQIRARHEIPEFIDLAHHNAVAGRDEWKDVRGLVVIGRTLPPPKAVEAMAGALTGRAIDPVADWYPASAETIRARSGQAVTVEADRHPDPTAEAVRRAICGGELMQIAGRARGVNRTAADPVEVVIFGNVPVPGLAIDALETWNAPTIDDEMLARGAWIESASDAAAIYGWTAKAIEGRRDQERPRRLSPFPYKELSYEKGDNLALVSYQRSGPGRSRKSALVDLRTHPDPRAWLESRLGRLAHFERVERPDPSPDFADQYARETPAGIIGVHKKAPAPMPEAPVSEVPAELPAPAWSGGRLGDAERTWALTRIRLAGVRQDDVARAAGLSRPQLTNALQGRFGLSPPAAARVFLYLSKLPARQLDMLGP